ncbi:MAG: hypothetical protein ACLPXT_01735 [Terracidiphilus sp.]
MKQNAKQESLVNDDEMRPEYDFSRGLRGVHAYRFSKLTSDEAFVLGYWQSKGFEVSSFAKREMRDLKTPDFRLSRDGVEVALCEVKSFQQDSWLEDQLKNAKPGELVGGLRNDPVFNRVSNAIHTAFKQFESVNSDHRLLNFLFLFNHESSAGPVDLDRVLTGREDPRHGLYDLTCEQFSEGRIRLEKHRVDLYVWFELDLLKKGKRRSTEYRVCGNPKTQEQVCSLLGIDPATVKDISSAA